MVVLLLGLAVVILDQLTKQGIRTTFSYGETVPVIDGFFNLVYVRNDGAAWNILSGHGIVLILISLLVLVLLLVYGRSFLHDLLLHNVLLGLMVGGILGNLIDRVRFGWVTDFLDFHIGMHHWPSFNVADSAICIAVGLYVLTNAFSPKEKKEQEGGSEEQGDG